MSNFSSPAFKIGIKLDPSKSPKSGFWVLVQDFDRKSTFLRYDLKLIQSLSYPFLSVYQGLKLPKNWFAEVSAMFWVDI